MTKALESLDETDAAAFREVLRPHVMALVGNIEQRLFIGGPPPESAGPFLWLDLSGGVVTFWLEDGQ
ncbi:hypothetical protein [Novosphingobium sp. KACC 22771]|uniref:hypothetical protein n=1 Tax=Novosphingobium sp. KACC 22771 TaxID=3025670 RepID=UPI0023671DBB|nr:hypothetical protein [Novosphingobium sp. KACC 22771]WDF73475.1 hypothetical protein PQ467_05365 [Novosphingobium sp. KACC 22771]